MDDLDQVLEALQTMQKAEGAEAVAALLGRELSRSISKLTKIRGAGDQTAREIVLKTGRLCWKKANHKKERG